MFKKAGDNIHYLDRTGSHSTKGGRTGVVHGPSSEDFMSPENILLRKEEYKRLGVERDELHDSIRAAREVFAEAMAGGDVGTVRAIGSTLARALRAIRAIKRKRAELAEGIPFPVAPAKSWAAQELARERRAAKKAAYFKKRNKAKRGRRVARLADPA